MNFDVRNLKKHETIFSYFTFTKCSQVFSNYSGSWFFTSAPPWAELLHLLEQINYSTNYFPSGDPCWVQLKEIFLSNLLFFLYCSLRSPLTYKVLIMKALGLEECKCSNNVWEFIKTNNDKHCGWLPNPDSIRLPLIINSTIWTFISIKDVLIAKRWDYPWFKNGKITQVWPMWKEGFC